jgi:hypothetical protein
MIAALMTKQFVAEVNGAHGTRWQVFTTGDDRYYLFVLTENADIRKPVAKTDLRDDVRAALAHGWGHR